MPLILLDWLMASDKRSWKVSGFLREIFSIRQTRRSKIVLEMRNIFRCLITLRCWVDFLFHNKHDRAKRCQEMSGLKCRSWKMIASRDKFGKAQREGWDVEGLIFSHTPTSSIATRNYRGKDVWDFSSMARIRRTGSLVNHVYDPESSKSALSTSVKRTRDNTLNSTILTSFPHFKRSSSFKTHQIWATSATGCSWAWVFNLLSKSLFIKCRYQLYTCFARSTVSLLYHRESIFLVAGEGAFLAVEIYFSKCMPNSVWLVAFCLCFS